MRTHRTTVHNKGKKLSIDFDTLNRNTFEIKLNLNQLTVFKSFDIKHFSSLHSHGPSNSR